MRSLSKKFLSNKKLFFSQNARLGLKLDGESKFAVKIDLATNLVVGWPKNRFLAHFWRKSQNSNDPSVARKIDMEI